MSNTAKLHIHLLDDDKGLIKEAQNEFPKDERYQLITELLTRGHCKEKVVAALNTLTTDTSAQLIVDWLALCADNEAMTCLRNLTEEDARKARVTVASWIPPSILVNELKDYGLVTFRLLHKPFKWGDVLRFDTDHTTVRQRRVGSHRRQLRYDKNTRYRDKQGLHALPDTWPVIDFTQEELDKLKKRSEFTTPHRGRLPWEPRTIDWFLVLTLPELLTNSQGYPERLTQWAIPRPEGWAPPTPDDPIEDIFRLMAEVGFYRGRYYEIDVLPDEGKTTRLYLTHANHPLEVDGQRQAAKEVLPQSRYLRGELRVRADKWLERVTGKTDNPLIYLARTEDKASAEDKDIVFWSAVCIVISGPFWSRGWPEWWGWWLNLPIWR